MSERPLAAPSRGGRRSDVLVSHAGECIMDVKEAVRTAKEHVVEVFSDEPIQNVGLEEVEFDESNQVWVVTVGFSRSWEPSRDLFRALGGDAARTFKIVRIEDDSGRVQSVKHRTLTGDQ